MKTIYLLFITVLFSGCATKYQETGLTGGFSHSQLGPDIFRVTFQGNGFTRKAQAADFALIRAAELTLENGFSHFIIVQSSDVSMSMTIYTPTQSSTTGSAQRIGGTTLMQANTTTTGGNAIPMHAPGVELLIRCHRENSAGTWFDAAFLAKSLKAKYQLQ